MTSLAIQNFGCRVNQAECFAWAQEIARRGLPLEKDSTLADIIIVNTCTLTSRADRDVRKFIHRVHRQNPRARIVLTGCSVEAKRAEFEGIPQAWLVFSNDEKKDLIEKVCADIEPGQPGISQPLRSRALLKVQDGCNFRCAFCVIPRVRGKSRSLSRGEILDQARTFVGQGFREIVLCGIHLSSYGHDLQLKSSLLDLLKNLNGLEGLGRVRLSSLDPRFLDDELLEFIASSRIICPHFHLSLQHGSDRILRLMGRESRTADHGMVLSRLRQNSPEAALGADIIAGFPGETEEDFEAGYGFLERSPLAYLHVFSYSARPGTPAASRPQVPEDVKSRRSARLRNLAREKWLSFRLNFLGRKVDGIVIKKKAGEAEVLTGNYINVRVPDCALEPGQEVKVKISAVFSEIAAGEIVG
ncbi:MAG: tRNA (N(6)-L-threonylcarbamoyladenosine(37)-C(2))-methylthiotransferase MtaB [Clostridiales bacterium]|jgi:threonylcarbamoyladenosine tRNA methylthiotransferase MtaB|nr:tRNA (N(6)-L-threonylcarbamoyladenosine(37)-C(2))-methylthiotransferase MtaB [Clostridiales bacterium]